MSSKVKVQRIIIKGVEYFKNVNTNMLYDYDTREEIGIWNPETRTIEELSDEEDEEPELQPKSGKVLVTRISIKGVEYLKDKDNVLYNPKNSKEIGIWNLGTKTIEKLPNSFYY
jgi:hypothetical protein